VRVNHTLTSVNGDGAVWPKVEQEEPRLFQKTSSDRACRVGGLNKAISLGSSLWASKEKELAGRQASETPPQANNLATTHNIKKPQQQRPPVPRYLASCLSRKNSA
jgi:hypothetical protein